MPNVKSCASVGQPSILCANARGITSDSRPETGDLRDSLDFCWRDNGSLNTPSNG